MTTGFSLTVGPLSLDDMKRTIATLQTIGIGVEGANHLGITGGTAGMPAPPAMPAAPRPTALPPMPGAAAPPPPPPTQLPAPSANPRLENVVRLMDAYAKAGNAIAGVRAVLAVVGLQRAQDANEEQLIWLEQAFANTAWKPN